MEFRMKVSNLFGIHNHNLSMNTQDKVLIINGTNGTGKTTMLKILKSINDMNFIDTITSINMDELVIRYNEYTIRYNSEMKSLYLKDRYKKATVNIEKLSPNKNMKKVINTRHRINQITDDEMYLDQSYNEAVKKEVLRAIAENRGKLDKKYQKQLTDSQWLKSIVNQLSSAEIYHYYCDKSFDDIYSLESTIKHKSIEEMQRARNELEDAKEILEKFQKSFKVRYIGPDRLYTNKHDLKIESYPSMIKDFIQMNSNKLSALSRNQESTFTSRLIETVSSKEVQLEDLKNKWNQIITLRDNLTRTGLLERTSSGDLKSLDAFNELNLEDITLRKVLALHYDDQIEKYQQLQEDNEKLIIFKKLVNDNLQDKKLYIDNHEGLYVEIVKGKYKGEKLNLSQLSSGEQHIIVLYYELIFQVGQKSIILIDEPEISLHLAWQIDFIHVLEQIFKVNEHYFIVATHSTSIARKHREKVKVLD